MQPKSGTWFVVVGLTLVLCVAPGCTPDPAARRSEIYELQKNPTPDNLQRIRERLDDEDRDVRATALYALVSRGVPGSLDLALDGLDDPDGFVRATAAKLLGDLEARPAASALVRHLLEDPDPVVRQRCAETLAILGGDEAEAGLVAALGDPLKRVRLAAVQGISALDPDRAVDALITIVREDSEWEIRVQAARGLGRATDEAASAALEAALEDRNEMVRAAAANALGGLDGKYEAPRTRVR